MLTFRNLEKVRVQALLTGAVLCAAAAAGAQGDRSWSSQPTDSAALTVADSVRSNLWLCESLMEDIAGQAVRTLRPAPGAVRVERRGKLEGEEILGQVVYQVLSAAGYEVFTDVEDSSRQAAVDYIYSCQLKQIELTYPRVGRTLGLWRQWVDRDLSVSADIQVLEANTGRLLFTDLVTRQFSDRIGAGDLDAVNSNLYSFTSAETSESGWHRRLEEIAVVGTLTGMVAVYFANTGN